MATDSTLDLQFFALVVQQGSLARAARELGVTAPAVSRRLALLEKRLGVRLLQRTTRRMSLTPEGEVLLTEGRRILADIETLEHSLSSTRAEPKGLLRLVAGFGFGRQQLGPAISAFVKRYPAVSIQLHLTDQTVTAGTQGFDIGIRFGEPPDGRILARKIASNRRLLCASPNYVARAGWPTTPDDLAHHHCIVLREGDGPFGTWTLCKGKQEQHIKVKGDLSVNHGEVAVEWALAGHGILLRSLWDIAPELRTGRLVQVLPEWYGSPADIYAVYPPRLQLSAKVRVFLDFLTERFAAYRAEQSDDGTTAPLPW